MIATLIRCRNCGIYIRRSSKAGEWIVSTAAFKAKTSGDPDRFVEDEIPCPACALPNTLFASSTEEEEGRAAEERQIAFLPIVRLYALHTNVLVVAKTRVEGAWKAYCAPVPGRNHREELDPVLDRGHPLEESIARACFPCFRHLDYAR